MDQDTALMVLCKVLEKASESSALSRIELQGRRWENLLMVIEISLFN